MLHDILLWWVRQMRSLLPERLLSDDATADALVVVPESLDDLPRIRLIQRRRRRELLLGRFRLDDAGHRAAKAAIRQKPQRVVLQPDASLVLERKVVLPLAAERDLTRVLSYEMDRLTPFTAPQVFWSAAVERRDRAASRLELCLTLVPKAVLQPVLAALDRLGLPPSVIAAVSEAGEHRFIDTQGPTTRRRVTLSAAVGLVGALALVAAVTPFVTQSLARHTADARIAALQPRIAEIEALRRHIAAGSAGSDAIAAEQARIGDALQVLAAVTDLLPDDTVLGDLSLRDGKLEISGQSQAAAQLIPTLATDPTVHNPSFAAPVTRTADGKADTFVIRAELSP
jgi:general secretion pathway protein L